MTIAGKNTLTLKNVMVGEVWLCAGQSNMGYSMKKIGGRNVEEAGKAGNAEIRIVTIVRGQGAVWEAMTPEVALKSSAMAYWFSKELQGALKEPVGLIVSSSPGTKIMYWVDPVTIAGDPTLNGKSVGKWYNELVKPVIPYGIKGAIWYQGESDADEADAGRYAGRYKALITNYRGAWGEGDFPWLFVQLPHYGTKQTAAGRESESE